MGLTVTPFTTCFRYRKPLSTQMDALEEKLGYRFEDQELLVQAMTHPSIAAERRDVGEDNQRLEFLGDAVLQLILTEHLYRLLPDQAEGRLGQHLVRRKVVQRKKLGERAEVLVGVNPV